MARITTMDANLIVHLSRDLHVAIKARPDAIPAFLP